MATIKSLKKPARGTARKERKARSRLAKGRERFEKGKVREREAVSGHCRWPHDDFDDREVCWRSPKEVAHLSHKGSGGDPRTIRSRRHLMLQVCRPFHRKIDRTRLAKVQFLDPAHGTDGPLVFFERLSVNDPWVEVGHEVAAGIPCTRTRSARA